PDAAHRPAAARSLHRRTLHDSPATRRPPDDGRRVGRRVQTEARGNRPRAVSAMSVGRIACVHVRRPGWFAVAALLVGLSPTTVAAQQKAASVALPPDQIATTPAIARPSTFAVGSTDDDPVV